MRTEARGKLTKFDPLKRDALQGVDEMVDGGSRSLKGYTAVAHHITQHIEMLTDK
jgi:hypothetical protein